MENLKIETLVFLVFAIHGSSILIAVLIWLFSKPKSKGVPKYQNPPAPPKKLLHQERTTVVVSASCGGVETTADRCVHCGDLNNIKIDA